MKKGKHIVYPKKVHVTILLFILYSILDHGMR